MRTRSTERTPFTLLTDRITASRCLRSGMANSKVWTARLSRLVVIFPPSVGSQGAEDYLDLFDRQLALLLEASGRGKGDSHGNP